MEGVPGLGKTKTIRSLAHALSLPSKRISFTPDLLPSDLIGAEIFRPGKGNFEIRKGPVFTSILLADEINRTPPKVQSALLEAMEEKRITIADSTIDLPSPFVVFATQNPLEHEGTYPLPEAQLDRFLMRIILSYPNKEDETRILAEVTEQVVKKPTTKKTPKNTEEGNISQDITEMIAYITTNIRCDAHIIHYVTELLGAYRALTHTTNTSDALLAYGPSTRAGIAMIRSARVLALLRGRDYILPEDIKYLAHDIFDHRIGLSYSAMSDGLSVYAITERILDTVTIQ